MGESAPRGCRGVMSFDWIVFSVDHGGALGIEVADGSRRYLTLKETQRVALLDAMIEEWERLKLVARGFDSAPV